MTTAVGFGLVRAHWSRSVLAHRKQPAPGHVPHDKDTTGGRSIAAPRLHRFLGREDDAPRSAGLLASATPTPSRLRSGLSVGVSWAVTAARLPRIHTGFPFAERIDIQIFMQPAIAGYWTKEFYL